MAIIIQQQHFTVAGIKLAILLEASAYTFKFTEGGQDRLLTDALIACQRKSRRCVKRIVFARQVQYHFALVTAAIARGIVGDNKPALGATLAKVADDKVSIAAKTVSQH